MAKVRELCGLIYSEYDSESDFAKALGAVKKGRKQLSDSQPLF